MPLRKRKSKKLQRYGLPATPRSLLGIPDGISQQTWYDTLALAMPWEANLDGTGVTRLDLYKAHVERIMPGYHEWHEWTERQIEGMLENRWTGLCGCASCVSGETRILNPLTGEEPTIEELCRLGIAPTVMTMDGPTRAEVPFVKGYAQLYRITLEDGRSFEATGDHRVLISTSDSKRRRLARFCRVSELLVGSPLLSYVAIPPASIWEYDQSTHDEDDRYSRKTTGGSLGDCRRGFCSDGEPLPLGREICQSSFPLPTDAPKRSRLRNNADDPASEALYTRLLPVSFPPSRMGYEDHHSSQGILAVSLAYPKIHEPEFRLFQQRVQCQQVNTSWPPFPKPTIGFVGIENYEPGKDAFDFAGFQIAQNRVTQICATHKAIFYDMTVPGPAHYFAEGAIHHNSAKTYNVAGFAVAWWLAMPEKSSVILCCTSISALRRKLWACVRKAYQSVCETGEFGNFVDSRRVWQAEYGNDKYAIIGIAVEEGSPVKVADNIKGHHTERLLLVLDEGTSIPPAIFDACANMWASPLEFRLVMMYNPASKLDQAGRFSEPANGWLSVNPDTEEWNTVPQMDNTPGRVIRFDALKSPNIVHGKKVSRYLPSKEAVDAAIAKHGSELSPLFWSNFRGFWPPEGIQNTVFTESFLNLHNAYGKWTFDSHSLIVGGFDPAFSEGGDLAIFRTARIGLIGDGMGIQLLPRIIIPVDANSSNPVTYQLAEGLRRAAEQIGCHPKNIVVDATNGAVCDVIERIWSPEIQRCMFQGKASELPVSHEDIRLSCDVYRNKRVELWFQAREYTGAGQLRGLDQDCAKQLCAIIYVPEHDSTRRTLEDKKEAKMRLGFSPDDADSTVLCIEAARRAGVPIKQIGFTAQRSEEISQETQQAVDAWTEDQYEPESDNFEYALD